jgi:hypothetical protein
MPADWGAKVNTLLPWSDDHLYKPAITIVHYFGGATKSGGDAAGLPPYSFAMECHDLRKAESWHTDPKRPQGQMRAIAYNEGFGQDGRWFYLRGPQHVNGGQYGSINRESRAVVFILGGNQVPSLAARRKFGRLWLEEPVGPLNSVGCHEDFYATACPGAFLIGWVERQGWIADLGVWKVGAKNGVISSVRVALHRHGYHTSTRFKAKFTRVLGRKVRRFQRDYGLHADGIIGPDTLRALGLP